MQIRVLAGLKRLMMVLAIASLIAASAHAATSLNSAPNPAPKPGTPTATASGSEVDDSALSVERVLFERSNYVWPYSSGPIYGRVSEAHARDAGVLHTPVGSFDLKRGFPNLPTELQAANKLATAQAQYFLLQVKPESFTNGDFDQLKQQLVAAGGAIIHEMPIAAFSVRMTQAAYDAISSSPSVIALVPFPPAFKLSPEIGRTPLPQADKAASSVYSLEIELFPGENPATVSAALKAMGFEVTRTFADVVFVKADRSKLAEIARLDAVMIIHEELPLYLMSEETTATIQTGKWNNGATPYNDAGIDGGGENKASQADDQLLMIVDNGIQLDAGDLSNTRTDSGFVGGANGTVAGHRKVAFYGTTGDGAGPGPLDGVGDLLGCDAPTISGVTHGHTVAAVALGNATNVPASYGTGWRGVDPAGNFWALDGVAPKARLIAYDGQITPLFGRCEDPTQNQGTGTPTALNPGNLYTSPNIGLLPDGYAKGARTVNLSWGTVASSYDSNAGKIDSFLFDRPDVSIFVAAGNDGRDKNTDRIPDPDTIGAPATAKNIICVGASRVSDDLGNAELPDTRWVNSSNGPRAIGTKAIAPLVMAPGTDAGTLGLASEFHCRSNDNDQAITPVECDVITGQISTSYASGAAAGAGLLVRDYFAMGFYPDGTNQNPGNGTGSASCAAAGVPYTCCTGVGTGTCNGEKVATISGALMKAILVASADWMSRPGSNLVVTPALTRKFRGNREQGFGRIQLNHALPLQSYSDTVTGLIVGDGGPSPAGLVNSTTLNLNLAAGASTTYALNVCDRTQPLTVAISWNDPTGNALQRDLNLEVQGPAPASRLYLGNFFTDDANDDALINATPVNEECAFTGQPWPPDPATGVPLPIVDTGPWSLPSNGCVNVASKVDHDNNTEAVFLSPDSRLNGINDDAATTTVNEGTDNQIEAGQWTIIVRAAGTNAAATPYSIAIAGGVCTGSAARVQRVEEANQLSGNVLTCNDSAKLIIDEIGTTNDPVGGLTPAEIASRTKVEVVDSAGNVVDTECGAGNLSCLATARSIPDTDFSAVSTAGNNISFQTQKLLLSDGTAPDSGNKTLDVRDGNSIRVTYQDENLGVADANAKRVGTATVSCRPKLSSGGVVFGQFGQDALSFVDGGCEKDARGYFTFGFPDRYMDAGELVSYVAAFQSAELGTDLQNISVSLRPVVADTNSPADCKPGSAACTDPDRLDNTPATALMTVLDSPKVYGSLPSAGVLTPSFTIQMAASITGVQRVDMMIGVTAKSAGKGVQALIAKREVINADEFSLFYSTDYPLGGAGGQGPLNWDADNNETLETVTTNPRNFLLDYVFETQAYSDMTSTNPVAATKAPWNFDTNNGGFLSGVNNTSRPANAVFAQWGEDKNFNGKLDGYCDGDSPPRIPCTQGIPASVGCRRCVNDDAIECQIDGDCASVGGVCSAPGAHGACDFTLNEDRNSGVGGATNGLLDSSWGTSGGCGWQTKAPGDPTGGVWHTGLIRNNDRVAGLCLAVGSDPGDCQRYWAHDNGDAQGDNNWWELLITPILNKVNTGVDADGPIYKVAITDWAWNMLVDIPETNTSVTLEFDTDVNKTSGSELFNDAVPLITFRGLQGAISGGNGPITNGFNMFARVSHCVDTDGNGSPDRCGTATGTLCGTLPAIDAPCTGKDITQTRGICSVNPAQKRCTGNPHIRCSSDAQCNRHCSLLLSRACLQFCSNATTTICANPATDCPAGATCVAVAPSVNAQCALGTQGQCIDDATVNGSQSFLERCVDDTKICDVDGDCTAPWGGTCLHPTGNNREGVNNCEFEGTDGPCGAGCATALDTYGLATPADDDIANGYCSRSDGLTVDKGTTCTSVRECNTAGAPYATVRTCSIETDTTCASNSDCFAGNSACTAAGSPRTCCTGAGTGTCTSEGTCTVLLNSACTGAAAPYPCCTGVGTGTCLGYNAVCNLPDAGIDEFVKLNGPGRNYGIQVSNGPDMRFTTLEDFFGDTGNQWRAALGLNNREPDTNTLNPSPGYGVAVDDMVISWKETRLDADTHNCAGSGECATLDAASTLAYEGNAAVTVTVTDKTPYNSAIPAENKNDCNGNDSYADPGDDQDCNNNGVLDVTVRLTSDAEVDGEIAVLDQVSYCSVATTKVCSASVPCTAPEGVCTPGPTYKANFPYSTLYNSPGTIFVVQVGTSLPQVVATYKDRNDGSGAACRNALEPEVRGQIRAVTTVNATTGVISVSKYSVVLASVCSNATTQPCNSNADCPGGTCNVFSPGDNDGFADTNELINLVVTFVNKSGVDVEDISATLGAKSPDVCSGKTEKACASDADCNTGEGTCIQLIECITRASILVGALKNTEESNPATYLPFQFKVASTANRAGLDQVLRAIFTITVRSNKFDALTRATDIPLDLDFDATGGAGTLNLDEDFEGGFGHYTLEFLDANKKSLTLSNGFRCQYNDPSGLNSNSSGNTDCFLGFSSESTTGVNDWHVHNTTVAFGNGKGRAYTGKQSLHLGVHNVDPGNPARDTTRIKHVMSVRSKPGAGEFINLPLAGANSELTFAQQVSFADSTVSNTSPGECVQNGVVELKPSSPSNAPWFKIYPYVNVYDQQGTDDFSNCMFDPTDDGNNEDSFFDPDDPARRLGPSSTCFPEFVFSRQGQIDYRKYFDPTDIGLASDGPGIQGCSNPPTATCLPANTPSTVNNAGTWVRTRFSMVPYAGRQVSVRFIYTAIEVGSTQFMDGFFGRPNVSADDGWFIDDIRWTGLLGSPISLSVDNDVIAGPLACGACTAITPSLVATPGTLSAPGQIVSLSSKLSTADRCLNGVLQYQFWNNANGNGTLGDAGDTLLRDWTDNSNFIDAPVNTTQYGVRVRCSTELSCDTTTNFAILPVSVTCPTSAAGPAPILRVSKPGAGAVGAEPEWNATVSWGQTLTVDLIRGDLGAMRSSGGITNVATAGCLADNLVAASIADNQTLGFLAYYLLKTPDLCNLATYAAPGVVDELPGAGGNRDADIATDPDNCP